MDQVKDRSPVAGLRPVIIPVALKPRLFTLQEFRDALSTYAGLDDLAEGPVAVAEETVRRVAEALEAFCQDVGLVPPEPPT